MQIGIDDRFNWESENLTKIAQASRIRGRPVTNKPYDSINELDLAINKIFDGLKSRPVAYDVEVIDTLYPYLSYLSSDESPYNITNNPDGSTTLKWHIDTMKGENTWSTTIHTRLKLSLPVDVSTEKTKVGYGISNEAPISEVRYTWLTGYNGSIPLPEGKIVFSSSDAPKTANETRETEVVKLTTKGAPEATSLPKRQPSFEVLGAIMGLMAMFCAARMR